MIKVNVIGYAARIFGRHTYEVPARPRMTLRDLLAELAREAPPDSRRQIYDEGSDGLPGHLTIFVNSREARSLLGLDTELRDGDVITLLPPVAGGKA